jgi:hypothetical protein
VEIAHGAVALPAEAGVEAETPVGFVREATTDKAVGIPVSAVELEPQNAEVAPEYWFDSSEVTAGA